MGDRKPSEHLRYLRSLVGPDVLPDSTLCKLWSQRLPPHVLSAIAALRDTDLTTVAEIADGVFENTSRSQVSSASSDSCAAFQDIQRQLAELRDKLSNSKPENRRHSPSRRPPDRFGKWDRRRSPNHSPARPELPPGVSWYHRRSGASAWRCTTPCSF